MAEYVAANKCPENVGGHEPMQYNSPLEDIVLDLNLADLVPGIYQAGVAVKVCKHCGVLYATTVTDNL